MNAATDITSTYLTNADLSTVNSGWTYYSDDFKYTAWKTDGDVPVVEFYSQWNSGAAVSITQKDFKFSQTVTMPAGYYRLSVNAFYRNGAGDGTNADKAWIFVTGSDIDKKQNVEALTSAGVASYTGSDDLHKAANAFSRGDFSNAFDFSLEKETEVEIGFQGFFNLSLSWCILGPVKLYEYTAADYMADYRAKVEEAESLYGSAMFGDDLAALKAAVVEESTLTSVDAVQNAIRTLSAAITTANNSITAYAAAIAPFNKLKTSADEIASIAYRETSAGSHDVFTAAISTQQTAATNAANAAALTTASTALKDAIKTFITGAEPANDGEYFNITCLMVNPDFDGNIDDWTYAQAPGVSWSNCEYYQSEFDINQTITGLPTGSYSLSVQAFQRPGWADAVWTAYSNGTDNASSVLYINKITSNVKNIMADAQDAAKLGTENWGNWPNDSRVGTEGNYKYVPNSQQGAKLYFDAGLYDATCAAVVTDEDGGSLKLGFKSTKTHVSGDWTIFDNFRLYYYGSSLLVYYKQYLPQLKSEASADLSNGAYANVTGSEKIAFEAALAATPATETEGAYKTVIDNITEKQTAFRAAAASYDALVAAKAYTALTKVSSNIGTEVFQYNSTTNDNLYSAYETAKSDVEGYTVSSTSTAAAIQTIVDALDNAISNYTNQALNAPEAEKRYYLKVATASHPKEGNAIVVALGATSDNNKTGYGFSAAAEPVAYMAQAFIFTKVSGNNYKISVERPEGVVYLTVGSKNNSAANWKTQQIQGTTEAANAAEFTIVAGNTDNVFYILNNEHMDYIDCQDGGSLYTDTDIDKKDFTLAEASQATVNVTIAADVKYATRIFPFTPTLPSGVKAYSCEAATDATLTLVEVAAPAANVPYILEAESGCASTDLTGWGTAGAETYTTGWLTGVYTATEAPVASYVLQNNDSKVAFYVVAEGEQPKVGANRCYLTVPVPSDARPAFFFGDDDTTGIEAINALTNGTAEIYNVNGVKVPALQKGMNIVKTANGKTQKILVK